MNKEIFGYISIISLIGAFMLTIGIFFWAFGNDYVVYEIVNASQTLEATGIISNETVTSIDSAGSSYAGIVDFFDWGYVLFYVTFFLSTILVAYYSREMDYFSFLNTLFWGTMAILFLISIVTTVSDWWISEILYKMIPNLEDSLVKFDYIQTNIGMLSFIQMLICIFANRLHFRIKEAISKQGVEFEDEVV